MVTPAPSLPGASVPRGSRAHARIPARLALRIGDEWLEATPVLLTGHEAEVLLEHAAAAPTPQHRLVELELAWDAGGTTQLPATVRRMGADGCRAHLDVHGVQGDWRSFLTWLGTRG